MKSTADSYFSAAAEHLASAYWLDQEGRFHLSHYFSGLSVECMWRALILKRSRQWDARHDLEALASEARFFDLIPAQEHSRYGELFAGLNKRWRRSHRYADEGQIWTYLDEIKADFNRKGDTKEIRSKTVLNGAIPLSRWE